MPEITRFPHYHQAENVVTNHVMVMMRELYTASPKLLERLIKGLCDEELTVGPRFSQQIAGSDSIPDGLIQQDPLAIFIETKLGAGFSVDQLRRHCKTIIDRVPSGKGRVLIALTSGLQSATPDSQIAALSNEFGLTVVHKTFGDLIDQLTSLQGADIEIADTIKEFIDFIFAQGLVPRVHQFMVAMLTGKTWRENVAHGVYYEPAHRSPKWPRATFLGLYHDKQVSHIGRITAVVEAVEEESGWTFEAPETGVLTEENRAAIRAVVRDAQAYYPEFQLGPHRYYVVDRFEGSNFQKETPGGMMGHRYFDIQDISKTKPATQASAAEIARLLSGKSFY